MSVEGLATYAIHFTWMSLASLLAYAVLMRILQQRRRSYHPDECQGDGLLVMHEWGSGGRACALAFLLVFVLAPSLIYVVGFIFAAVLAAFEGWHFYESFAYVLCNMVGMNPMVNLVPSGAGGIAVDIMASMWSLMLTTTVLGLSASINFFTHINSMVPTSLYGLMRVFLIYLPLALSGIAACCGVLLSVLETWSIGTGMLFMLAKLCGIQNPLTDASPATDEGNFFVSICVCLELSIGGAIIGIISTHPVIMNCLVLCEGEADSTEPSSKKVVIPDIPDGDFEAGAQQRIQQLEEALEKVRAESVLRVSELEQALTLLRCEKVGLTIIPCEEDGMQQGAPLVE